MIIDVPTVGNIEFSHKSYNPVVAVFAGIVLVLCIAVPYSLFLSALAFLATLTLSILAANHLVVLLD